MTIVRLNPAARYADATIYRGVVHTVEVPASEEGDITEQTRSMLAALEKTLEQVGSTKAHLLMATLYLCDMADYDGMNAVWEQWLPHGAAPARACVQVVRLAKPGWRVEIAVQAVQL